MGRALEVECELMMRELEGMAGRGAKMCAGSEGVAYLGMWKQTGRVCGSGKWWKRGRGHALKTESFLSDCLLQRQKGKRELR